MSRWVYHSSIEFEACHALTSYFGRREEPHSHRWRVAVEVEVGRLGGEHYGVDFSALHAALAAVAGDLEGANLNDDPEIGCPSPTAERLAEVMASRLQPALANLGGALRKVCVWEGPDNQVDLVCNEVDPP